MTPVTQVDTSALTEPVDRARVRAFSAQLRREGSLSGRLVSIIVLVIVGAAFLLVAVPVFGMIGAAFFTPSGPQPIPLLIFVFFFAVVAFIGAAIIRGFGGAATRRYRLDRFARANGMTWHPGYADPDLPGMIFDLGHDRQTSDLLRGDRPRPIEIGNYSYETGSGKNKQTHRWGYVALQLDAPLPHIVLDAVGNNGLFGGTNLPVAFGSRQRLSLEGDFDGHFALYCPQGYERDALYLFTPDVMARFIDNAAALDVEIVDDRLFLYSRRDLSTLDPAVWEWLFATVAAIDDKLAQWARWRDERLRSDGSPGVSASGTVGDDIPVLTPPPAGVAASGRRLKRSFSWVTLVVAVVIGGWWMVSLVFGR